MSSMPVIRAASLVLAHAPSLVRLGSKPLRELRRVDQPTEYLRPYLRDWPAACAYAPNQVFIGNVGVDDLAAWPAPWHRHPVEGAPRFGPDGEIMPEDELLGLLASCDGFNLLALERDVAERARVALDAHPIVGHTSGRPPVPDGVAAGLLHERIERHGATPLRGIDGRLIGAMLPGHEEDDTLTGQVLLENLACKATAGLALRHLLARPGAVAAENVRYLISCGEEAV
ncbi:MAG: glycine reductase, partial [Candidatus Rokuibacteriota bacterium]